MRFAISIPQGYPDGTFDPAAFAAYLLRAEGLGFESAWAMDQTFGRTPRLNALETMTFAAACTALPSASGSGQLRLGCSVWISPLHQPVQLAKSLATLDQLSRGRLEIGFGSGGQYRMFSAFGITGDHLITRFTEGIEIMTALWTEVCLAFPTLDALRAGFEVYPVVDAVGGTSPEAHRAGLERIVQAGAKPISWVSLACELQRDWARVESVPDVVDIVLTTRLLKTA